MTAPDWELYTDGSSFMENGQRQAELGLPHSIQGNNGPSFTSEISQKIGQALQIHWKL